jgi:hypothetical protein
VEARISSRTFDLTGPINLSVRISRGAVTVRMVDGLRAASVDISSAAGAAPELADRITVQMEGPTLTVSAPREHGVGSSWRRGSRDGIEVAVSVPSGTALAIATSSAPITVRGRCGGADILTGSGDVTLDHVDGDLRLRGGGTRSHVARVSGSVASRSGAGAAHFGVIEGSLQHGCGSGTLDVQEVHGSVRSRNGSGSTVLASVHGDVDLASGSGAMRIGLPANAAARLHVTTGSGRVRTDLPIDDEPAPGSARIAIRARTGSGDITFFRAA